MKRHALALLLPLTLLAGCSGAAGVTTTARTSTTAATQSFTIQATEKSHNQLRTLTLVVRGKPAANGSFTLLPGSAFNNTQDDPNSPSGNFVKQWDISGTFNLLATPPAAACNPATDPGTLAGAICVDFSNTIDSNINLPTWNAAKIVAAGSGGATAALSLTMEGGTMTPSSGVTNNTATGSPRVRITGKSIAFSGL